jgi:hypothetical protein
VIAAARRRLAMWLWPAINTAHGKRALEQVARECGASRTLATSIAARYFRSLHHVD